MGDVKDVVDHVIHIAHLVAEAAVVVVLEAGVLVDVVGHVIIMPHLLHTALAKDPATRHAKVYKTIVLAHRAGIVMALLRNITK